jgi:RNA polymerase sigma factor (sigma-70 family)
VALPPFQSLLNAHGRTVHRFLVASVGPIDADDCYQETWLSALRAYPQLRSDANLRAWLMTIAHRKAIDHVRARARRPLPDADAGLTVASTDPVSSGLDPVWDEVAQLPDKQRTAVALRYLGDLSHAEIGTTMGINEAAARRNVHEGLKRLREEHQR